MIKKKKYFKSLDQLKNNSVVSKIHEKEFIEKLPNDLLSLNNNSKTDSTHTRRDFLKMVGFTTAAASLAACEAPVKNIIPYVVKPEEIVPGIANWYASSFYDGHDFASLLVKTREGRPIFLKSNDKCSLGGVSARVQASVLNLYDNNRLKNPKKYGKNISWKKLDEEIIFKLKKLKNENRKIVLLSSSIISPTNNEIINQFKKEYNSSHIIYDPVSSSGILDANKIMFGLRKLPTYRFDLSETIVSFDADFLGDWIDSGHGRDYAKNRNPENKTMSTHFQFESILSLTGANADFRSPIKASKIGEALVNLYNIIALKSNNKIYDVNRSPNQEMLTKAANSLWKNRGKSILVSGINDVNIQLIVNKINQILGNYDKTINLSNFSNLKQADDKDILNLLDDLKENKVGAIINLDVNPVYNLSSAKDFQKYLKNVDLKISISEKMDETASLMDYVCPKNNYLESWGDCNPYSGIFTLIQPTINKLFNTRQLESILMNWSKLGLDYYSYLKSFWKKNILDNKSWNTSLHDGFLYNPNDYKKLLELSQSEVSDIFGKKGNSVSIDSSIKKVLLNNNENSIDLILYSKTAIGSGKFANNPWLQELPDPISKTTWDNYLTISPRFAQELGLSNENTSNGALNGDVVSIKSNNISLEVPVLIQPGQAYSTVGLAIGYGRKGIGDAAQNVGVNAFVFMKNFNSYQIVDEIKKINNKTHEFACTQLHHTMMGRDNIVKETLLSNYLKNPKSGNPELFLETHEGPQKPKNITLWNEHDRDVHWWNLSIDLSKCIGCGACVIACHSENNVPVVGKDEIRKSRDMHWLRIDRYYSSDMNENIAKSQGKSTIRKFLDMEVPSKSENLEVVFQPVMCQHCNHAPCETVCPVAATTHSREGLNHMTYNRCIGTRYCANNCPYKVRRFNWFNYSENDKFDFNMNNDLGKMVLNPDVTVRGRGVMEKCSMCIQNIQKAKLEAKKQNRKLSDGEVDCACETACDTGALVFGDVLNKKSKIYSETKNPRSYHLLEELNTKPSVWYQTKVRNK